MLAAYVLALLIPAAVAAQDTWVRVTVTHGGAPVPSAQVIVNGATHAASADGTVTIAVAPGRVEIVVSAGDLMPARVETAAEAGQVRQVDVELLEVPAHEEEITVSAARTDKRLQDVPMRVEVLAREEIEEKMLMTPGDIVMMLNEMGGMRVQATSPSLGAASVRIQGMRGRYTRFFSDGLPLFGEVGGLGLLQIPPMDLGRVEVIKGVVSSLYGAGAMGGIVNLISRRPPARSEREFLVNRSSRGATDLVGWYATPAKTGWAFTLLGGGHWQDRTDVDEDGWADLAGYSRGIVRPRVFWDDGKGRTVFGTVGFTAEERRGGTMHDAALPAGGAYAEALDTRRMDAGAVGQLIFRDRYVLTARAAFARQRHDHRFGDTRERDHHDTAFGEVSIRGSWSRQTWVAGAALERDAYRPRELRGFAYTFVVPGVFVQDDVEIARWISLSASARLDRHSEYGWFASPRLAALLRHGQWNSRVSVGTGFFGPSPLTEETEAAGLSRLEIPSPLKAEQGRSMSVDVSRTQGPLSYTATVFASRVEHPLDVNRERGLVLTNAAQASTTAGLELLGTWRREPFAVTANYAYVRARERGDAAPLTPRHSAGAVGMWEREETGRIGVEVYYTGRQRLEVNPYRERSEPYVIVGVLIERQFDRVRLFVNGENLTGVRQTRWDPLLRPSRAPDGRWTVDAWAPLEGRTINGGIRVRF